MTERSDVQAVNVVSLRTPARIAWEALHEIRASFPSWHVWYSVHSATWNAHRKGQEPYFGFVPDGVPMFMVSASTAAELVALLEWQVLGDMAREFPTWQVGRTDSGTWYALTHTQYDIRLVQGTPLIPLMETVRAIAQHWQRVSIDGH